jgi:prolyl oligopeptidase
VLNVEAMDLILLEIPMPRIGLFILTAGLVGVCIAAVASPPPTRIEPVRETLHGVELVDDYRWLEGGEAGQVTDEVAAWTDAQSAFTRQFLDSLPGRPELEARLRELMQVGSVTMPIMRENRYFYRQREGSQSQPLVYLREGPNGPPRLLLDPSSLDAQGLVAIPWISPSPDGSLLAFGLYRAGDEKATLYLLDVERGEWLADEIPGKVTSVSWLPDGKSFVYRRLADVANPYSGQYKIHRVGTHHRHDPILLEQEKEGPLATTWGPMAYPSRDGRWLVCGYWTDASSNDLWVVDLDRWRRSGELVRIPVLMGEKARSYGPVLGDTLYLQTTFEAPNGRVIAVDLHRPERGAWREIVAERKDAVLEDLSAARGLLVATYLKNASSQVERFALDGRPLGAIELPGIGSARITTEADRTEAFLSFESFNEPDSIYRVELQDGELELWERPAVPVDPASVEVRLERYPSKDGTEVTMFVIHRKGLPMDGDRPTLLYGYGGFNNSMTPFFAATLFPWFEAGGVYAVPHLRGGGEYGESWHRAGMLDRKQNTFDDFIAAAEWLVKSGITRPGRLAIAGGSNGGLLTGAVLVQRPDLCAAAVVAVPLLDMLRYHLFLMARYWVPEYGSSEDPEQFRALWQYSPYHNVKKGTRYPAVFLTAGENDSRVHPSHARKMAALLQASTASDPETHPVLLWIDREAGHGQGKPLELRIRDVADQRIFVMRQLGMLPGAAAAGASPQ